MDVPGAFFVIKLLITPYLFFNMAGPLETSINEHSQPKVGKISKNRILTGV